MNVRHDKTLRLLNEGRIVRLCVNTQCVGVIVPEYFAHEHDVRLDVGLNAVPPIPDLMLDDVGISGTLAFNNGTSQFFCATWHSIWAIYPVGEIEKGFLFDVSPGGKLKVPRKRGHLTLVVDNT